MSLIAIYGANGTLGRRVSRDLVAGGADLRLAGRNATKLEAAAVDLAGETAWRGTWTTAALDDHAGLRRVLEGCRVVVNASPTAAGGERLIDAAIGEGVHYIDAAGSQPYIHRVFEHHGPLAAQRGTALAPAFGFDYALGDCLAHLVAGEPAREVTIGYAIDGSDVSSNSLQFAAETAGGGEWFYEAGRWTPARLDIYRCTIDFPEPFGRQSMARYAAGEVITVPRHVQTDRVTTLITTGSLVPHPALIPFFPYLRPIVALARRTPARHLLSLAVKLRRPPAPAASSPDDPPPQPPRFAVVVEIEGRSGVRHQGIVQGGDFHEVTTVTLALGARALAAPTFNGRGALAPSAIVEPARLFEALARLNVTCRVTRIDADGPTEAGLGS